MTEASKKSGRMRVSIASSDSPGRVGEGRPVLRRLGRRRGEGFGRAGQHELAGREVVVRPGVDPEQLRVALDLGQRPGVDTGAGAATICSSTPRIAGCGTCSGRKKMSRPAMRGLGRGARSVPSLSAAAREAVRVQLHHRGLVDALEGRYFFSAAAAGAAAVAAAGGGVAGAGEQAIVTASRPEAAACGMRMRGCYPSASGAVSCGSRWSACGRPSGRRCRDEGRVGRGCASRCDRPRRRSTPAACRTPASAGR